MNLFNPEQPGLHEGPTSLPHAAEEPVTPENIMKVGADAQRVSNQLHISASDGEQLANALRSSRDGNPPSPEVISRLTEISHQSPSPFATALLGLLNGSGSAASGEVIEVAKSQVGEREETGEADKYLLGMAQDADKTPWCAGFVNWVLEQKGLQGTDSLAAQSFIQGDGKGHVGFKVGESMLGGNQGNEVCERSTNPSKQVAGWVMPEDVGDASKTHKGNMTFGEVPDGAIVVTDRDGSQNT